MTKVDIIDYLSHSGIPYELTEHAPVFTIEDMLDENLPYPALIAKNLFVRDDKKLNYYLITVKEEKRVNLKDFQTRFGTRKLSFASEDDLMRKLGLTKGSVTPFGLLNNPSCAVQFYLDKDFLETRIGIHPNENTATIWLNTSDLITLLRKIGIEITIAEFEG